MNLDLSSILFLAQETVNQIGEAANTEGMPATEANTSLMGFVQNVGANVLSGLVVGVLAWLASFLFYSYRRRRFHKFWGLSNKGGNLRIVLGQYSEQKQSRGYRYATVASGDAEAATLVTSSLSVGYQSTYDIRCFPSGHFTDRFWSEPVIMIGGATRNKQTRDYLASLRERCTLPFEVYDRPEDEIRSIVDTTTEDAYNANLPNSDVPEGANFHDYGLVLKGPNINESHKEDAHFVLYGLHAFGTIGAAELVSTKYLESFRKQLRAVLIRKMSLPNRLLSSLFYREPRYFECLVKVEVLKGKFIPKVADAYAIRIK